MHTLMITSTKQGLSFDAETAVAPFAMIEKLASFAGRVLKAFRSINVAGGSFRTARA